MNSEKLRDLAVAALDEMKGSDIVAIDVTTITDIADFMVICTGRSTRHVKALAETVSVKAKEQKVSHVRTEGENESEWVLVDLGDVIVHVMTATARGFYSLEDLWEPVRELRDQQAN